MPHGMRYNSETSRMTPDSIYYTIKIGDPDISEGEVQPDGKKSSLKNKGLEKRTFEKLEKSPEVKK